MDSMLESRQVQNPNPVVQVNSGFRAALAIWQIERR
jgi:hypothetical protein